VRSDPEPDDVISVAHTQRSIPQPDPNGMDRARGVHLLEAQARVLGILPK